MNHRISVWSGKTPAELSVIDKDIMNVARFPREDPYEYSTKYLEMLQKWEKEGRIPVTSKEIGEFRGSAVECLKQLAAVDSGLDETEAVQGFEKMWPKLSELLKERPFYEWVKEHAMNSAFLYTYFVDLSGRAPALEMANGKSWDITGKIRLIPECDAAYYFRVAEPTFLSFTQRIWFSLQEMLKKAIEIGWRPDGKYDDEHPKPRKVKIAFLGGGLLPQLRSYDLNILLACEMFEIVVYDSNPELPGLLAEVFGKPIEEFGIKFVNADFSEARKEPNNEEAYDIVLATGVVSYITEPERLGAFLSLVRWLLVPGGVFVCDRQVFEESMKRCVFVLRWRGTGMKPDMSADEAITAMTQAVAGIFEDLVYEVDQYNEQPAIVNFAMKKAA